MWKSLIDLQQFVGFEWGHKYYVFTVLRLPVMFSLLRPLVKLWRGSGIRCIFHTEALFDVNLNVTALQYY